jgi:hypothetical protein
MKPKKGAKKMSHLIHGILRNRRRNRGRLGAEFRAKLGLSFVEAFTLASACCDIADEASDAELDQFHADAVGGGDGTGFALFEDRIKAKLPAASPLIDLIIQLIPVILPLILSCFA